MTVIVPILLGFAFGWLLHKARLGRYETIVGVFSLRDPAVLQFLLAALTVAAVGVQLLVALGVATAIPVPRSAIVADLIGGLVFGAGMALAGFCPATVAAGAAEGRLDHLVAGGLGLYTGAVVLGLIYPRVLPLTRLVDLGPVTASHALGVSAWLLVVLLVEVAALVIWAIERWRPWHAA
jgi:hypothetical protein